MIYQKKESTDTMIYLFGNIGGEGGIQGTGGVVMVHIKASYGTYKQGNLSLDNYVDLPKLA